jgi:hypothetical protein
LGNFVTEQLKGASGTMLAVAGKLPNSPISQLLNWFGLPVYGIDAPVDNLTYPP